MSLSRSFVRPPLRRPWRLIDVLNEQQYVCEGDELTGRGLYVDLPGYGYHVFELQAV